MLKRIRNLKWMVVPAALMLLLLSVPVVHGGGRWSGIDGSVPVYTLTNELAVNGHVLNAEVKFPQINTCSISDVFVTVTVPKGTDVVLTSEGSGTFDCHDGNFATFQTHTTINYAKVNGVKVSAMGAASETFITELAVYKNGALEQNCSGESNKIMACGSVKFDADSSAITSESTSTKGGGKGGGPKK